MMPLWQNLIDSIYPAHRKVRGILLQHSENVARLALDIAKRKNLDIDAEDIENAAMLHDIGIIETDAPGIDCHGTLPYLCHGVAGADIIRRAGLDEKYALVAERHTGAGLDDDEARQAGLPEGRCYMPCSLLEKLICYADCFYSKGGDGNRKSLDRVRAGMARHGDTQLQRFEKLHDLFG